MRQRRTALVARLPVEVETKAVAGRERDPALDEAPEAQLWSLQIGQNADRPARRTLDRPDRFERTAVVVVRTVAEVEPEHVDPGVEQRTNPLRR